MSTFYRCTNNGMIAVISQETYEQIQVWLELVDDAKAVQPYPRPIFTFERLEHYEDRGREVVTGDYALMDTLLTGHRVVVRDFFVPFSNATEYLGGEAAEQELRFRTTLEEAIEAFGLVVEEPRELVIS